MPRGGYRAIRRPRFAGGADAVNPGPEIFGSHHVFQSQPCDAFDLAAGGGEFRFRVMAESFFEMAQDARLVVILHGDDERKPVFEYVTRFCIS